MNQINAVEAKPIITKSQPPNFAPPLLLLVVVFVSALEPEPEPAEDVDGVEDDEEVDAEEAGVGFVAVELPSASLKIFASGESAGRFSIAANV